MRFFTKSSRGLQATIGMDQKTVNRLLIEAGATGITFISEDEYNAMLVTK